MSNKAAYILESKGRPFVVKDAPLPVAKDNQVVVKVHAVAINPVDASIQNLGMLIEVYPAILGCDMAGEVYQVGSQVKHVKVGDRVTASVDMSPGDKHLDGVFQDYAVTHHKLVARIPDSIAYTDACVLPLAMCTAATGLFDKRCMGLELPNIKAKPTGSTVLIWGGASSVGACAIQLTKGAGYDVIATASKKNFEFCKSLGASAVFDYSSSTIVDDVVAHLKGKKFAGAFDAVMPHDTLLACAEIAKRADGFKHVGTVCPAPMMLPENRPADVEMSINWGTWLRDTEVSDAVFVEWIPKALANGTLKCKPDAEVVGKGLDKIQAACDAWTAGISAKKMVVEIL